MLNTSADGADNTGAGATDHGQLTGLEDDDHPQYATDMSDMGIASGTVRDLAPGQTQTIDLKAFSINRSGFGRAYGYVKLLVEEDPNPANDRIKDVQFVIQ